MVLAGVVANYYREGILITIFLLVNIMLGQLLLATPAAGEVIDRIVAVVNGEPITLSELQELARPLLSQLPEGENFPPANSQVERELLNQLIEDKLKLQQATRRGITVSDAQLEAAVADIMEQNGFKTQLELEVALAREGLTLVNFKSRLKDTIKTKRLLTQEVYRLKVNITDKELQDYCKEQQSECPRWEEWQLRHILLALPEDAAEKTVAAMKEKGENLRQQLVTGADFAQLAREYSDGPTAAKGGDIGYFKMEELLPEFEAAVASLQVGELSPLFQTRFGFHIIKLSGQQVHSIDTDPKLKQQVKRQLMEKKKKTFFQDWLENIKEKASINIML